MSMRCLRCSLTASVLCLAWISLARADVIYVKWDAIGADNGTSWQNAFVFLQDALAAAQPGDQVWVARGTYTPDRDSAHPQGSGNQSVSFNLLADVSVYGGFTGTESSLNQRTIPILSDRETILSGDLLSDDEQPGGTNAENSYHVLWCENTDATACLDGFTVRSGNAPNSAYGDGRLGAGLFVRNASPIVANCVLRENIGGDGSAASLNGVSSARFVNCAFLENSAYQGAGAAVAISDGVPWFANCVFSANSAARGSALHFFGGGEPLIVNCTFSHNSAPEALYSWVTPCPAIANSIFWNNGGTILVSCAQVTYCCIQGGGWTSGGNISTDPKFIAADGGYLDADSNLRLRSDSPCIDKGSDIAVPEWITTDIEGIPRFIDGNSDSVLTVDMGAYEYHGYCEYCPGARVWINPQGGLFRDHANWAISAPGSSHPAVFSLDTAYTVTFDQNAVTDRLILWLGNVTFDFGTGPVRSYDLASTSPQGAMVIGELEGDNAALTITGNGELATSFGSVAAIGSAEDSVGLLEITGAGASAFLGGDLCVGCAGDGTLNIFDGGTVTSFTAAIADLPGSTGVAHVLGAGSSWDIPFFLVVGNPAPLAGDPVATLIVEDGGTVDVGPGGILVLQNGQILGDGTINGDVVSIGGIGPGLSPGVLTINGEYEQVSQIPGFGLDSGHLNLEVGGADPGQYDQLVVTESVTLGGGLFVKLLNDFVPSSETDLPLLLTPLRAGNSRFDVAFFPGITGDRFLTVTYGQRGAGDVSLVTLPLPGNIDMTDPENVGVSGVPNAVAVGDFDADGLDDLVVTIPGDPGQPGSAVVLLTEFDINDEYAPTTQIYTMGVEPCALVVGQFDGQAGLDIAVANAGSDDVRVLTNSGGTGAFNPVTPDTTFPVGNEPRGLTTADFDKDGRLDLAVANSADNTIQILLGTGRGIFTSWGQLLYIGVGANPVVFTVDPFDPDNDDDDDVAVACENGTVAIFVNLVGPGGLDFAAPLTLLVGQDPVQLATANLTNTAGRADLVTVNRVDGTVSVLLDTSAGPNNVSFSPAVDLPVREEPAGSEPRSIALFDVDEDGDSDIVVVAKNGDEAVTVRVLRNDLSGDQLAFASATDLEAGDDPVAVTAADLNGDAKDDLVAINGTFGKGGSRSGSIVVRLNHAGPPPGDLDGDGDVDMDDPAILVDVLLGLDSDPDHVARADLNLSGTADGVDIQPLVSALLNQ